MSVVDEAFDEYYQAAVNAARVMRESVPQAPPFLQSKLYSLCDRVDAILASSEGKNQDRQAAGELIKLVQEGRGLLELWKDVN